MRLDQYLVSEKGIATRNKAQDLINEGLVSVNGKIITKNGYKLAENDEVVVNLVETLYVSRAAKKLKDALTSFDLSASNKTVIDVGASTGGFSEVCLEQGANLVYAVDVGYEQLVAKVKNHPNLISYEGMNARYLDKEDFPNTPNMVVMDVSFISIKLLIESIQNVVANDATWVILIKPQFEAGKQAINKHGVVKERKEHQRVISELETYFNSLGLYIQNIIKSTVVGKDGNQEYVCYLTNTPSTFTINYKTLLAE